MWVMLEGFQLRISALRLRAIGKADSAHLQIAVQSFQQMRAANMVNRYTAAADGPPLDLHAVAMAANMHANHARPKGLEQLLGILRVVTQISEDQSIAVIAGANLGPRQWRAHCDKGPAGVPLSIRGNGWLSS
jgi:hypothetical protein